MLTLLFACVTADSFPQKATNVLCERYYECDRGAFESAYSDLADCKDDDALIAYYECFNESCTFVAKAASECLSEFRSQSCEDLVEGRTPNACEDIYEDCDESELLTCAADAAF